MISISQRAKDIPVSATRVLLPFADVAKKSGKNIYHLNIWQPDVSTYDQVFSRLRESLPEKGYIPYWPAIWTEELRKAVSGFYKNIMNIDLSIDSIIMTIWASEAIDIALNIVCDTDDKIIVFEPFYANYLTSAHTQKVSFVWVECKQESGFSLPNSQDIEKKITEKTKAILLCSPSNPTGYIATEKELRELLDVCKKHNLFLVVDEVYNIFSYDSQFTSILQIPGTDEHVIVIDSVSKRYNLCGARIGMFISRNKEVLWAAKKYCKRRLSLPMLESQAAITALSAPQEYYESLLEIWKKRRDCLLKGLQDIPGIEYQVPAGAIYLFLKLPVDDAFVFSKRLLTDFEYEWSTVMLAPWVGFFTNPDTWKKRVRVAYVKNEKTLQEACLCLKKALEVYNSQTTKSLEKKWFVTNI